MIQTYVLEQMVKEQKSEELARLDAVNIVNNLFSELLDRECDVLSRRFGLKGGKGETLEKIGQMHKLTRERVRQIEVASIRKIKKLEKQLRIRPNPIKQAELDALHSELALMQI